ncbi:MAG: hypothetical protein ACOX79_13045 [Methanosarcina sp.]
MQLASGVLVLNPGIRGHGSYSKRNIPVFGQFMAFIARDAGK